jgi:hypothetical protein
MEMKERARELRHAVVRPGCEMKMLNKTDLRCILFLEES